MKTKKGIILLNYNDLSFNILRAAYYELQIALAIVGWLNSKKAKSKGLR